MTQTSLLNEDWPDTVERLGGTAALKESARETKAFLRGREFEDAIAMLRMILALYGAFFVKLSILAPLFFRCLRRLWTS